MFAFYLVAFGAPMLVWFAQQMYGGSGPYPLRWILLNPFELCAIGLLAVFAGTRVGIGTDFWMYQQAFQRLDPTNWNESIANTPFEPGFTVLVLSAKLFGGDSPEVVFLVLSTVTVVAVYLAIRLVSANPALALAIYLLFAHYLSPLNIVRQGLAVALMLLAAAFIQRARIASGAFTVVALLSHSSAWVGVPILLVLRRLRVSFKTMVLASLLAIAGPGAFSTLPQFRKALAMLNERYVSYLDSAQAGGFGIVAMAVVHFTIAAMLFRVRDLEREELWWRNAYALAAPLTLLGISVVWAARLAEFVSIFLVLIAPNALQRTRNQAAWSAALLAVGVAYYAAYLLNFGGLLPYASWLFTW